VEGVDGDCLVIDADTEISLNTAEAQLITRYAAVSLTPIRPHNHTTPKKSPPKHSHRATDPAALRRIAEKLIDTEMKPEKRRHVFVDNSNLFIGAQNRGECE
jgi:hypothetical protein